jgi:hypothetical protein
MHKLVPEYQTIPQFSVGDPDPDPACFWHFGLPGSRSVIQRYISGSGSGSFSFLIKVLSKQVMLAKYNFITKFIFKTVD